MSEYWISKKALDVFLEGLIGSVGFLLVIILYRKFRYLLLSKKQKKDFDNKIMKDKLKADLDAKYAGMSESMIRRAEIKRKKQEEQSKTD